MLRFDDWLNVYHRAPSFFAETGFKSPRGGADGVFQSAYDCKGQDFFTYMGTQKPEMARRFGSMMQVWTKGQPRWADEDYYPVQSLLQGAESGADSVFVVDVGGGRGQDLENLIKSYPELPGKLILQDRPEIIAQVSLEGVEATGHDFFQPQPVKGKE